MTLDPEADKLATQIAEDCAALVKPLLDAHDSKLRAYVREVVKAEVDPLKAENTRLRSMIAAIAALLPDARKAAA